MATVAVEVVARIPGQPPEDDETSDVTVEKLRLVGALKKGGINLDVTQLITDGSAEDSTTGAPQLTISIIDRDYAALQSGVFGQTVDIALDGIPYRLVEVELTDVERLTLTFEHKLVNLLRQHKSALKASRSSVTRAQFFEIMLKEIAGEFPVRFVCPEVNTKQPIAGSKSTGRSLTAKTVGSTKKSKAKARSAQITVSTLSIRYWDGSTVVLGPQQLANAQTVLETCAQLNAGAKATLAVVAACIVEPDKPFDNPSGGSGGSQGILQFVNKPWATDIVQSVTNALQDPGATGKGGMISLAQKNPGWTAGQVAQAEQGSAFPTRYDAAVPGAQTVINAFGAGGQFAGAGVNFGSPAGGTYEFSRGQPGQPEDSWTCMTRLAREVNWRVFVAGRNSLYFVTDDDLITAPPAYQLSPDSPGVVKLTFQAEVGGRTVRVHRHRQPKPSEAQLTVRIDRWQAVPGGVLTLDGYGPADERWIIVDAVRPLFDRQAQVHLQSPQAPLPEPTAASSTQASGATSAGNGTVDAAYAAARAMDAMNLPYSQSFRTLSAQPNPGGYDCSASVSWVLLKAGFTLPNGITWGGWAPVSGDFESWGQAGKGAAMTVWFNAGHIFIEFIGFPAKRFDTVPGGSGGNGPHLRYTAPGDAGDTWEASGFQARHVPGI